MKTKDGFSTSVVVASGGYPGTYEKGKPIKIKETLTHNNVKVLHAGTKIEKGELKTNGGRVLNIVSTAPVFQASIDQAYQKMTDVYFEGMYYRKDIGAKGIKYIS